MNLGAGDKYASKTKKPLCYQKIVSKGTFNFYHLRVCVAINFFICLIRKSIDNQMKTCLGNTRALMHVCYIGGSTQQSEISKKLKADQPHPRNYPRTPTDYRHIDKHLRLLMTTINYCYLLHSLKQSPWYRGAKATMGVYEAHLHQAHKPCAIGAIPSQTYGDHHHTWYCSNGTRFVNLLEPSIADPPRWP